MALLVSDLPPALVVAADPDSTSTALAWAVQREDGYAFAGTEGGGSRCVSWQTITGARAWLESARAKVQVDPGRVVAVVETQAASGPRSKDVEELRRVRYHWQAACEVDGSECVFVDVGTWTRAFLRGTKNPGRGAGAIKRAYQVRAKELTALAVNEDRCAAIGMLWWYVVDVLGSTLIFDPA